MNLNLLLDPSTPFTGQKLQMLEQLSADMHSGNPQKIQESEQALEALRKSQSFWLQTDTVLQNSNQNTTLFFALMALHGGVKAS